MVATELSTKYLKKLIGGIPISKLSGIAARLGVEVKESNSKTISIDVTPDRPDMLCAVGFARALRNFSDKAGKHEYKIDEAKPYLEVYVGKKVKSVRPFISGLIVKGLELDDDSLRDLISFTEKISATVGRKRKKLAMGLHNLDSINPPLIYDAFKDERFVPLGSKTEMSLKEILGSHKKGQEYINTIGGSAVYPALKDSSGIISMIPIINSDRTKISVHTQNLFLDITGTSRFYVEKFADVLAAYFLDLGAKVYKVAVRYTSETSITPKMDSERVEIPMEKLDIQLGAFTHSSMYGTLAKRMGYVAAIVGKKIMISVPAYRSDVINDQDIISDITIAYGYDRIKPLPIYSSQQGTLQRSTTAHEGISQLMLGMGFSEQMNSYLTNEETNFTDMRMASGHGFVKLKGSRVQSLTMMRTHLLPSLLKNCGKSTHDSLPQKLFELDMAFSIEKGKAREEYHLAAASVDPKANFNEAVAAVRKVIEEVAPNATITEHDNPSFIPGRSGSVAIGKKEIGSFGELHPEVLERFGIEEPAFAFELNLSELQK